jgi:iron complex outermembrane receptor protein
MNRAFIHLDYSGTSINFFDLTRTDVGSAWTQEFQLQSLTQSKIQWVVGAFVLNSIDRLDPFSFGGPSGSVVFGAPAGQSFNIIANTTQSSYAVFGQATYPVLEDTSVTLGARYTIDGTGISGYTGKGDVVVPGSEGNASTTTKEPTYRVGLQHQMTPSLFTYASYNRGYNVGGYNNVEPAGFAPQNISLVRPETIDAYEVGLKSQWFDNRLRLNAAAFYYSYKNLQEEAYQSGGLETLNAAAAQIKGLDIDFEVRPISALTITGGLELLDSTYSKYPNAPIYSYAPNGALISTSGNAAGNQTISAPKVGFSVSARHVAPTAIGSFASSAALTYSGGWYADASNKFEEPAHTLVNLSETWTALSARRNVSVWAKNVGNVRYDAGINLLTPVGVLSEPGAPRTFGITFTQHF